MLSAASGRQQLLLHSDTGFIAPGQLERFIPGISTKVLTERLRRMLAYGLITRTEYPEFPLRVEYHLTPVGEKARLRHRAIARTRDGACAPQRETCCSGDAHRRDQVIAPATR